MEPFSFFFWTGVLSAIAWVIFYYSKGPALLILVFKIAFLVCVIAVIALILVSFIGGHGPHWAGLWW